MDVTVSVFGRFHAFYLARELAREGHLDRLITSHPRFSTDRWGVPRERVRSLWPVELGRRVLQRISGSLGSSLRRQRNLHELYDRLAASRVPAGTDLFVGWSGHSEKGIERANQLGALSVVERGSSHIRVQREILREEYERHGVDPRLPSARTVEKEEREYAAADYVAVPSEFAASTFRERDFPSERLIQVPLGVDTEGFAPRSQDDSIFRVVFVGQLSLRKGVPYLIEAFDGLGLDDAELVLIGPRTGEITRWLDRCRFELRLPGTIPHGELDGWYSQGDVLVLPSVEDGFGMVLLEAMACGIPVIATRHCGAPDVIRDGEDGFLVPIRDSEELQRRILWCYENREACRAMGRSARQKVTESYTWRDYGRRIASAYRNRLGGTSPGSSL